MAKKSVVSEQGIRDTGLKLVLMNQLVTMQALSALMHVPGVSGHREQKRLGTQCSETVLFLNTDGKVL